LEKISRPFIVSMKSERIRADLALLLVAIIWGSAFAAQRVAAVHMSAFLFNGTRFLLGALILLPLTRGRWRGFNLRALAGSVLAGVLLFGAAGLQQIGLQSTTAGNAGFITGLYVVLVPIFLAFGWRRWPQPITWLASLLAAAGLYLLSTGGQFALAAGDALELAGAVLWALHVILIGRLVQNVEVLPLVITQDFLCGLLNLALLIAAAKGNPWAGLPDAWWTVVYTAVFSIGLGYTLQAAGQRVAPPADAAIILSGESVFAAFFGGLLLNERLAILQVTGCGLILASMLLAQANIYKR
jgi:drug/metabolite transporter (DMT)-like permease